MTDVTIRTATTADLPRLHPVIERAYRGDAARQGWTHEADLLTGARIDDAELKAMLADPDQRLLIAEDATEEALGCVSLTRRSGGVVYLGLLCVDPTRQAGGVGKAIMAAAETTSRDVLAAQRIEMTVIDSRVELIAYYERRGYVRTGERRPFPYSVDRPLTMAVLEKGLR